MGRWWNFYAVIKTKNKTGPCEGFSFPYGARKRFEKISSTMESILQLAKHHHFQKQQKFREFEIPTAMCLFSFFLYKKHTLLVFLFVSPIYISEYCNNKNFEYTFLGIIIT